ncbi:otoancorin [Pelobates fuscus]|uniref:otoancorin n=1 Tax=Pelobates fuscus TaxID=191477 RepID=UPI002FE4A935
MAPTDAGHGDDIIKRFLRRIAKAFQRFWQQLEQRMALQAPKPTREVREAEMKGPGESRSGRPQPGAHATQAPCLPGPKAKRGKPPQHRPRCRRTARRCRLRNIRVLRSTHKGEDPAALHARVCGIQMQTFHEAWGWSGSRRGPRNTYMFITQDHRVDYLIQHTSGIGMGVEMKLCLLLMVFLLPEFAAAQSSPVADLPMQLLNGLNGIISGKYLLGLLDILQFHSSGANVWTPGLIRKIGIYLSTQNIFSIDTLKMSVNNYLDHISEDPKFLMTELRKLDSQQFQLTMKYLFGGKKEHFDMVDFDLDFEALRERILQCPGAKRIIFLITLEKCLPVLNSAECVDILSQVIRMYGEHYLQRDVIANLPSELPDEPFKNLSSVFKELYDKITANDRRALYEWMTEILQKNYMNNDFNGSTSWVTAENLWILGRYMVHLPVDEIRKINVNEIRMFISYDNATKQLDTVYDITPDLAKAFLELINSSGFDMRNISTIYRLGLLVCFYDDVLDLDPTVARALLHQMIKCNQLRSYHADVQKMKSQFLQIAMLNQTLNESLGSLSDAVVSLTLSQLEALSPEAVQGAILTLQQVSGWTKSQIMVLTGKYLNSEKVLTFSNMSHLGELVSGISAQSFYDMNPRELSMALKVGLSQHASGLSPAQQESILSRVLSSGDLQTVVSDMNGAFFREVPLSQLLAQRDLNVAVLKEKEMRTSQALLLYELMSHKTSLVDLLSTGYLVKGVTCEQIDSMSKPSFLNHYKLFEKNLHLLSPYQIHCLAWRYWKISQATIPPFLLAVLPSEYFVSYPPACGSLLISLGKIDLDSLLLNKHKKEMIINKINQCLNGSITDVYQLDMLGNLVCHLSPGIIRDGLSTDVIEATIHRMKSCTSLSQEQNVEIKHKILEHYGNPLSWTSETVQDMTAFWNLLSEEEFNGILKKFLNTVVQMVSEAAGISLSQGMLSALFHAVQAFNANASVPNQTAECTGITSPTDENIVILAEANLYWSSKELYCMGRETFHRNVHILGSISGFNHSQLSALKNKAKEVWGNMSDWRSYHVTSLGRIATALSEQEIDQLDLSSIDAVSALGKQEEWTFAQKRSILQGFLNNSNKSLKDLKSFDLAGLGGILCAAKEDEINQIQTSEFRAVISRIGSLPCSPNILQEFKKKAEMVYGKPETWTSYILQDIGYIAAGLNKEEFKLLQPELMPYIQPAVIKYILDDTFKVMPPEQIASLGPENSVMVTDSQRAKLDTTQLQSLDQALDGVRATSKDKESTTSPSSTIVFTSSPVSDSDMLSCGNRIVYLFFCHFIFNELWCILA